VDRLGPGFHPRALRTDVECEPMRTEAVGLRELQELDGFIGRDPELAAERQLTPPLGHFEPYDHSRSGREARDLAHLRLAVDHEQVESTSVRLVDVRRYLDRRTEDHPLRRHAEGQDTPDLVL